MLDIPKDQTVLVQIGAAWCGPCRVMKPIAQEVAEKAGVLFVYAALEECPGIDAVYEINSVPTFLVFVDGKEVDRFVGARSKAVVDAFLRRYV